MNDEDQWIDIPNESDDGDWVDIPNDQAQSANPNFPMPPPEKEPETGKGEAAVRAFARAATLGQAPRISALTEAALDPNKDYDQAFKDQANRYKLTDKEHPWISGGVALPTSLAATAPLTAATALGRIGVSAGLGALDAAGVSDLETKEGLSETAKGGMIGSAFGAGGEVLGKGLRALTERFRNSGVANRAVEKFNKVSSEILGEPDVTKLNDIRKNISRIDELVKSGRNSGAGLDVTEKVRHELDTIHQSLGSEVGKFRDEVLRDTAPSIPLKEVQQKFNALFKEVSTSKGESLLRGQGAKDVEFIKGLLKSESISPSDALKITDEIDEILSRDNIAKGNVSGKAQYVLQQTRKFLKEPVHKKFSGYAEVDAPFSRYKEAVENIEQKINGVNGESYLKNIFNAGKTEARTDLEKALNLASEAGKMKGLETKPISGDVFDEIKSINTANDILGRGDTKYDQANRIVNKTASKVGSLLGMVGGAWTGSVPGTLVGGGLGYQAGTKLGQHLANPNRVIDLGKKANEALAKDPQAIEGIGSIFPKLQGINKRLTPALAATQSSDNSKTFPTLSPMFSKAANEISTTNDPAATHYLKSQNDPNYRMSLDEGE